MSREPEQKNYINQIFKCLCCFRLKDSTAHMSYREQILLMFNSKFISYSVPVIPNSLAIDTNPALRPPPFTQDCLAKSVLAFKIYLTVNVSVRPTLHLKSSSNKHLTGLILLILKIFIVPQMICLLYSNQLNKHCWSILFFLISTLLGWNGSRDLGRTST